jgi:hypothetical protein
MPTYSYKNNLSKKIYEYKAVHDLKLVDNIADKLISEHPIQSSFTVRLRAQYLLTPNETSYEVIYDIIKIADDDFYSLPVIIQLYIYDFHRVASHLHLRLDNNGRIKNIENKEEIQEKWLILREILSNKALNNPGLDDMIKDGDSLYGEEFSLEQQIIDSSFYRALFPPIYNSELEKDIFLREEVIQSAFNKDINIPVEVFYEAIEGNKDYDFFVTTYFMVELIDDINKQYAGLGLDEDLTSYYYRQNTSYKLDSNNRITEAEAIQQETVNIKLDVLEHVHITLIGVREF